MIWLICLPKFLQFIDTFSLLFQEENQEKRHQKLKVSISASSFLFLGYSFNNISDVIINDTLNGCLPMRVGNMTYYVISSKKNLGYDKISFSTIKLSLFCVRSFIHQDHDSCICCKTMIHWTLEFYCFCFPKWM